MCVVCVNVRCTCVRGVCVVFEGVRCVHVCVCVCCGVCVRGVFVCVNTRGGRSNACYRRIP